MKSVTEKTSEKIPATQLYIDGHWVEGSGRETREIKNPADGSTIAEVAYGSREDARKALDAAGRTFPAWSRLTGLERSNLLRKAAALMRQRQAEIARLMTLENGKPLSQSLIEVEGSAQHFDWYAEEARRTYGRLIPHQTPGKRHLTLQQPVGVAAVITPWNFPLMLLARKAAPALAAGCTVVAKPAGQTPLVALAMARCCEDAGFPPGVINVVIGPAEEMGKEFLENPICRKISFTGSTEVGAILMRGAAGQIKNLSLELGGHCPVLVFDDADLKTAVQKSAGSKYRNTGQSCIAANRIFVQEGIYEAFLEAFVRHSQGLKVAPGLEEGANIGPLIDKPTFEKVMQQIDNATSRGARLECGGQRLRGEKFDRGYFVAPTVLTNVSDDMLCMCEETFGPMIPVVPFSDELQAIGRANNTKYGLAAYVHTRDIGRAFRVAEAVEAGTVAVNDDVPSTTIAPFGGVKQSGLGRECGVEGIEAFLETKHVSICLPD
ncbi:MAG TPA: NAD-dependent succinate-semialdehyde dehydrogenase [Acidobacteriota bacterium]